MSFGGPHDPDGETNEKPAFFPDGPLITQFINHIILLPRGALGGNIVRMTGDIKNRMTTRDIAGLYEKEFEQHVTRSKSNSPFFEGSITEMKSTHDQMRAVCHHLKQLNNIYGGSLQSPTLDPDELRQLIYKPNGSLSNEMVGVLQLRLNPGCDSYSASFPSANGGILTHLNIPPVVYCFFRGGSPHSKSFGRPLESDYKSIQLPLIAAHINAFVKSGKSGIFCVFFNTHWVAPKPTKGKGKRKKHKPADVRHMQVYVFSSKDKKTTGVLYDPLDPAKQAKQANDVYVELHKDFQEYIKANIDGVSFEKSVAPPVQRKGNICVAAALMYASYHVLGGTDQTFSLMLDMLLNGTHKLKPEQVVACYVNAMTLGLASSLPPLSFLDPKDSDEATPGEKFTIAHSDFCYVRTHTQLHTHISHPSPTSVAGLVSQSNTLYTYTCTHSVDQDQGEHWQAQGPRRSRGEAVGVFAQASQGSHSCDKGNALCY
jgi:hypothetical protein